MKTLSKILKEIENITQEKEVKNLSQIEIDLVKEKLRDCYDLLLGQPVEEIIEKPEKEPELKKELEPEIDPASIEEEIHQAESETEEIESDEIIPVASSEKEKEETIEDDTPEPDLFSTPDSTPDVNEEKRTVAENISEEVVEESVAEKIQKTTKIDSLKVSIGINEKFFFINELFDGNLNDYNDAIEEFDKIESLDGVTPLLNSYSEKFGWPQESEAKNQLVDFIERKLK